MNITPCCWHVGNTYLFVSHNLAKSSKQWAADYNYNTRHYCIQTCKQCLAMLYHSWRWCFNKIFTPNATSQLFLKGGWASIVQGDFSLVLFKFVKQSQTLLTCLQHTPLLFCIILLPSHCFMQHYLRFSPCHSIFTQNTAGARQLAAWSYCW